LEKKDINNYEDLEINLVSKISDGTQFVSIGNVEHISIVNFRFFISKLFSERLDELGVKPTDELEFINIVFRNRFIFNEEKVVGAGYRFSSCTFYIYPTFTDKIFKNKVKFRICEFGRINVTNATFEEYTEFYDCLFSETVVISKCSFNDNVVFTKSNFRNNCLFTYTTFEKLAIFSRAKFEEENGTPTGLDLSQSIINGELIFFETILKNFKAFNFDSKSIKFDKTIIQGDVIPLQNKRETVRIIKHQLLQQNNVIEAEKYAKLEKQTLMKELLKDFNINRLPDLLLLLANKLSNNYKTNWLFGLAFITIIAFICHSILSISEVYKFNDFKNLAKLINVADFSFYEKEISTKLYVAFFMSKIAVGFGIYQLIQAFRKYK
jgi:hypothetical protein